MKDQNKNVFFKDMNNVKGIILFILLSLFLFINTSHIYAADDSTTISNGFINKIEIQPLELGQLHLTYTRNFTKSSSYVLGASYVYAMYMMTGSNGWFRTYNGWVRTSGLGVFAGYQYNKYLADEKVNCFGRVEILYKQVYYPLDYGISNSNQILKVIGGRIIGGLEYHYHDNIYYSFYGGIGYRYKERKGVNLSYPDPNFIGITEYESDERIVLRTPTIHGGISIANKF